MKNSPPVPPLDKETKRILLAEDDRTLCRLLESLLVGEFYQVRSCHSGPEAKGLVENGDFHMLVLDLALPPSNSVGEGLAVMRHAFRTSPRTKILVISGEGTLQTALACIREGAEDYLTKPIQFQKFSVVVERILSRQELEMQDELRMAKRLEAVSLGGLIGRSEAMRRVFKRILEVAEADFSVLILGETGTGKGVAAETIHHLSHRRKQRFVKVNCSAIPEGTFESDLFGHRRGSFSGACENHKGRFEHAEGGTLFLDEIAELPSNKQSALLHAVEEKEIQRMGANHPVVLDIRIISATNADLRERLAKGRFRPDLYYRINTSIIEMPPLRERGDDVLLLAEAFLRKHAPAKRLSFSGEAEEILLGHDWPGNVRELESIIQGAANRAPDHGRVTAEHLEGLAGAARKKRSAGTGAGGLGECLDNLRRSRILGVLIRNGGNITRSAKELGLSRSGLYKIMRRLGIRKEEYT